MFVKKLSIDVLQKYDREESFVVLPAMELVVGKKSPAKCAEHLFFLVLIKRLVVECVQIGGEPEHLILVAH